MIVTNRRGVWPRGAGAALAVVLFAAALCACGEDKKSYDVPEGCNPLAADWD